MFGVYYLKIYWTIMHIINIPPRVYEDDYKNIIKSVSGGNNKEHIRFDFQNVTYLTPLASLFIIIKVQEWVKNDKKIEFINHETCPAFKYLQRINFFDTCGVKLEENFTRHSSKGKFVPIESLINANIEELSTAIAECIAPELKDEDEPEKLGFFNCIEYSVSELGNNTVQHAKSHVSYISAQYSEYKDFIRVAIVDDGIGIKESFFANDSPHQEGIKTHLDAIHKALEPKTSSKTHLGVWGETVNAGVGLTLLKSIAKKINGTFSIFTGNAYYSLNDEEIFENELHFSGTLCSFTFKRSEIHNFNNLLYDIKKDVGLISSTSAVEHEDLFI